MKQTEGTASTTIPRPVKWYFLASVGFWLCCIGAFARWRFAEHLPFPYSSPLMPIEVPLRDLWCYRDQFKSLHSLAFFADTPWEKFPYPPGSALPFAFFSNVMPKLLPDAQKLFHSSHRVFPTIAYLALTFGGVAILGWISAKALQRLNLGAWKSKALILAAFLLMFPFMFEVATGNIEIVIYLTLASAMIAYLRGRFTLAALLIGFAGSMKFYPFVLVGLLPAARRWKETGIAVISLVVFLLAGLWLECPDLRVSYHGVREAMAINRVDYMQHYFVPASMTDHSLFGIVKAVWYLLNGAVQHGPRSVTTYTAITAVLGLTLYVLRIRHQPVLNQIVCLYLSFLLLVPESFEYTLMHLSVPWALLLLYTFQRHRNGEDVSDLTPIFLCLAFALSAENELLWHGNGYWGQAKSLVLITLFGLALIQSWDGFTQQSWISPKFRITSTS